MLFVRKKMQIRGENMSTKDEKREKEDCGDRGL
jgi:hypothetical protein